MRIKNSIKNIYISIVSQIIVILLGFLSRKVFVDNLGTEYLGINGLLTNILLMLGLVECGIGTSIVYSLYKPLADNDIPTITALVKLYKKIYTILAVIVLVLSIVIYPMLNIFIRDGEKIPYLALVYFIFVIRNIISYLNAHKWSLIYADQKNYIIAKYNLLFNIATTVSKIIILLLTKNYILFLIVDVAIFVIQNVYNGSVVNKLYPYIMTKGRYFIDNEIKSNIVTNVKALFLHNIASYCVFGTDNMLIAAFINVKTVGLYSNYTMIIDQLSSLINVFIGGIGASVGNLIATESKERSYEIFKITYFINFWMYSLATIFLYNLIEPFINWWLGGGFILNKITFITILVNFYITGLRQTIITFKCKAGIFRQDKYIPLFEAVLNLALSIILVKYLGLAGIFMATTISTIVLPLWIQSKLVYNIIFNKSAIEYFKQYIYYILIMIFAGTSTTLIVNLLGDRGTFISLVIRGVICAAVPNTIYILIFIKTDEFKYILSILQPISNKFKEKIINVVAK